MLAYKTIQVRPQGVSTPFFQADLPLLPPSVNGTHVPITRYVPGEYKVIGGQYVRVNPQYKPAMVSSSDLRIFKRDMARLLPSFSWTEKSILKAIQSSQIPMPLSIHFNWYHAEGRTKADTDNRIKHCQDAVFKFLKLDDNLVDYVSAMYCFDGGESRTEIEVSCYTQEWAIIL